MTSDSTRSYVNDANILLAGAGSPRRSGAHDVQADWDARRKEFERQQQLLQRAQAASAPATSGSPRRQMPARVPNPHREQPPTPPPPAPAPRPRGLKLHKPEQDVRIGVSFEREDEYTGEGALVRAIHPYGLATQAGLRVGDIVLSINGKTISCVAGF